MVYYDLCDILLSIPISFTVGIFASILTSFERILIGLFPFLIKSVVKSNGTERIREYLSHAFRDDFSSPITCFFGVITIFIIFILLSYVLFFGQIRLYVFLIMICGFFVSDKFISRYVERGVRAVACVFVFFVGKFISALRKTLNFICKKTRI